ncbi:DUF547 domain-containing protein [Ponticaulis sp.]|uniref:DUF547 domain-containing protein n=1 Tax=Ponticaulis sp. TaxID=2020902 RepID=UPI0025E6AF60|nr:DUF547 domain-containing protein [Ponticaulis sp.]
MSGFATIERLFAPDAQPWERWKQHNPTSTAHVDHAPWQAFLDRYLEVLDGDANRVRYGEVTGEDRSTLDRYIETLTKLPIGAFARNEQLAYWINLYNALTVQVVLNRYPVKTILDVDIAAGLFSNGPWDAKLIVIEGEGVSLNDIEHRILRPLWRDPRIHYVLNCASIGCPDLRPRTLSPNSMDSVLTRAAQEFVNSSRGVSIEDNIVTVSRIYDWFHEDFGSSDRDVLGHIAGFAEPELRTRLEAIGEIHRVAYDWRLNDAP